MTLDRTISERNAAPTPWELAQYRAARGFDRAEWSRMFDEALPLRHDDSVLRMHENAARRMWCAPAPAALGAGPRPNLFRALFRRESSNVADSCFDADNWAVDGLSGKVSYFRDYVEASHFLFRSTSANQVPLPAADTSLAGAPTAVFGGAEHYDSTRTATRWKYRGDGTGVEEMFFYVATNDALIQAMVATRTLGVFSERGMGIFQSNGAMRLLVGNATSTGAANSPIDTGYIAHVAQIGQARLLHACYTEGLTPEWELRSRVGGTSLNVSGASNVAPEAGDPPATLRLGAATGGAYQLFGRFRSFWSWRRRLTNVERAIAFAEILGRTAFVAT